jgi:hypothetical protein
VLTEERGRRRPSALSKEKRRHTTNKCVLRNFPGEIIFEFFGGPPFFASSARETSKRRRGEKKEDKIQETIRFATKTTLMRYSSVSHS